MRCPSTSFRAMVPKIVPGMLPIISGMILRESMFERRLQHILRLMMTAQRVQTATAVLILRMKASKGMAIRAEPNPVRPWRRPARRKIAGTSRKGDMILSFAQGEHG